jgi:hypothetical protein
VGQRDREGGEMGIETDGETQKKWEGEGKLVQEI